MKMENEITVREADIKDLPTLLDFEQQIIHAERPFDPTIREGNINYYNLKDLVLSNDAHVLVACSDEEIVASGYAVIKEARHYLNHKNYGYLGFMYTVPKFRGRGINGRIMDTLRNWVYSKGLTEVRLTVYDDNEPAIRAYEKVGFKKHIIEMRFVQKLD